MHNTFTAKLLAFMVGLLFGGIAVHIFYKGGNPELLDEIAELTVLVGPLERSVTSLRQKLNTCLGAQASRESSLEEFYDELIIADRLDIITFNDDGVPTRLVFDCGGAK